ncbi:MAG: ParB/RepB/Spo0J family partition protein [Pseudomonadota bacterium]
MKLTHLPLDQLNTSAVNVRKHGGKDIADLMPSIRSLGLIQPLLVRPNCQRTSGEGFEIVAGQRRFNALTVLAGEKLAEESPIEPVPCIIMEDGDDATAIEASLAENITRLPMDEIDQYKAFAALIKQGREASDIALQFGVTERLVTQRLAIANLIDPILNAYRREDICADTVRVLTMASKTQQKAWWALFKDDDAYAPQGYRLKEWLFGGNDIPAQNSLFDEADYTGSIITDLFGDERYFDDAETFWSLQSAAIAKAKDAYLADGWQEVTILDIGEHWTKWEHEKTAKEDGGRVYVHIRNNGEVTFHEGYITTKEAKKREQAIASGGAVSNERPELTKAMQNYLALHRHAAVRVELLSNQGLALRVATAQIIAGAALWNIHADPQKANSEAVARSLPENLAQDKFAAERQAVLGLLDLTGANERTLVCRKHDYGRSHDLADIFARLVKLDDKQLMHVFTFVIAETLSCGSGLVEALGKKLETDMSAYWSPDETFFDLLRDKEAVNAVVKEVAGKATADAHIASTAKVQKSVIRQHLDGTRKPHKSDWQPRYMSFPMNAYTKRGGPEAIESVKPFVRALKKHAA